MITTEQAITSLDVAQQYAAMAGKVASLALPGNPVAAYIELGANLLALASQAVTGQTTEGLPDLATLDAQELVLLAQDARAQADAAQRAAIPTPPDRPASV